MSKRGSANGVPEPSSKRRKEEKLTGWEDSFTADFAPVWDAAYAEDPEAKRAAQLRWLQTLLADRASSDVRQNQAILDCLLQSYLPYDPERLCNPLAAAKKQIVASRNLKASPSSGNHGSGAFLYFNGMTFALKPELPFLIGRSYDDHSSLSLNLRGFASEGVSRVHAEISRFPENVWRVKSLSRAVTTCGVLVNSKLVPEDSSIELHKGDTIRIGAVTLSFFH